MDTIKLLINAIKNIINRFSYIMDSFKVSIFIRKSNNLIFISLYMNFYFLSFQFIKTTFGNNNNNSNRSFSNIKTLNELFKILKQ